MSHHHHHHSPTKTENKFEQRIKIFLVVITLALILFTLSDPINITRRLFISDNYQVSKAPVDSTDYQPDKFILGRVERIIETGEIDLPGESGNMQTYQLIAVTLLNGPQQGKTIEIKNDIVTEPAQIQTVTAGDHVVITEIEAANGLEYYVSEKFRLPAVILITLIFFVLIFVLTGYKGLRSIIGMVFSIFVITNFIVPRIIAGDNPLLISMIGALAIGFVSLYISHGFNHRSSIALVAIFITIAITLLISILFVQSAQLFGGGTEEAFFLKVGRLPAISLQGLLLGGIIIGVMGILDDITTAQTAAVEEISKANRSLGFWELYNRGISVGHEHIISLVNTLVLAYTGSSLPLLLLFTTNENIPGWVTLNTEPVVEEIIRTLVGSSSLIMAVPIATFLAAFIFSKKYLDVLHPKYRN